MRIKGQRKQIGYVFVGILLTLFGACKREATQSPSVESRQRPSGENRQRVASVTPVDVIADFVFAGYMGDGERPGPIQINDG